MRVSNLAAHRAVLAALRAGETSFDAATRAVRPALEMRAVRFLRVWKWCGQTSIDAEDLVQEMTIALWRAVDAWDPKKADLIRYVDAQLGRACQRRLRQVAGYPDPRRPAPARQIGGFGYLSRNSDDENLGTFDRALLNMAAEHGVALSVDPETALDAKRRADALLGALVGLERHVVELVLDGGSLETVTRRIYADRSARIAYRMDSIRDARRLVGDAVRKATTAASAA